MVAAAKEKVDVGDGKHDEAKAPTRSAVARPRLPVALAAAPKPPKVVPPRRDATGVARRAIWKADCTEELCSRCQGRGRAADVCPASAEKRCSRCNGRGHAADVCPSSNEEAVLAVSSDDGDEDTVQASAFKTEEAGEYGDVLGRMG